MHNLPTPEPDEPYGHVPDEWLDNPAVRAAEAALRVYGEYVAYEPMTRGTAERLLPSWAHYRELSPREVRAVLSRFPSTGQPEPEETPEPRRGGGWISGSMGGAS